MLNFFIDLLITILNYCSFAIVNLVNSDPLNILDNLLSFVFFHSGILTSETILQKFFDLRSS